jgi:hypothetical protein
MDIESRSFSWQYWVAYKHMAYNKQKAFSENIMKM